MSGSGSERLLEIIGKWMEKYLDGDTQTGVALSMVLGVPARSMRARLAVDVSRLYREIAG
jgi:hypothetical protein